MLMEAKRTIKVLRPDSKVSMVVAWSRVARKNVRKSAEIKTVKSQIDGILFIRKGVRNDSNVF